VRTVRTVPVTDTGARPRVLLAALEAPRAVAASAALRGSGGLLALAPRGDGSPVVVLPGSTTEAAARTTLRGILRRLGHDAVGSGLGRNLGPIPRVLAGLDRLLSTVADRHGKPLSLGGLSLGGVFARHLTADRLALPTGDASSFAPPPWLRPTYELTPS